MRQKSVPYGPPVPKRSTIITHPGGRSVFCWDGVELLEYWRPEIIMDGTLMKVQMKYRKLK